MGRDKALLEIGGIPLLLRNARMLQDVAGSLIVIGSPERYASLDLDIVPEGFGDVGPLSGIATALSITEAEWNLIVACDMPYLTQPWMEYLLARATASRADIVLGNGLCLACHKRCGHAFAGAIARGERKVGRGMAGLRIEIISEAEIRPFDPDGCLLLNANTPPEFELARLRLEHWQAARDAVCHSFTSAPHC